MENVSTLVATATLTIVMVAAAPCARAQGSARPAFGLYAGVARSAIKGDSIGGPLYRTNVVAGASISLWLNRTFVFEPGLEFAQKGTKSLDRWGNSDQIILWDATLSYVEMPLLLRMGLGSVNVVRPYVVAGPELAFKVSCKLSVQGASARGYSCADLTAATESFDYGVIAGVGVDFRIGRQVLTALGRYDGGLRNAFVGNDGRSREFAALVGVRW